MHPPGSSRSPLDSPQATHSTMGQVFHRHCRAPGVGAPVRRNGGTQTSAHLRSVPVRRRRSSVPGVLVGFLILLTLGAAVLGLSQAPSTSELVLQNAAGQTVQAPSFVFHTAAYGYSDSELTLRSNTGIWRAPDQLTVTNRVTHRTLTVVGSTIYLPMAHGFVRLRESNVLADPFDDSSTWLASQVLPPIGLLSTAKIVTVRGDEYSVTIPVIQMAPHWIAYAPLDPGAFAPPPPGPLAYNTRARVLVRNGYVVRFTFPDGVNSAKSFVAPETWTFSSFGSAPPVHRPS